MKKEWCHVLTLTAVFVILVGLIPGRANAAVDSTDNKTANPPPDVMPSLRQWTGGHGSFTFSDNSRIVINKLSTVQLRGDAETFQDDLQTVTGLRLPIVTDGKSREGDVYLSLNANEVQEEGYRLDIGTSLQIEGKTVAGVFYGMQTVLQIVKTDDNHKKLPYGSATDYPDYRERGFMIDSGHSFATAAYIEDIIRQMAWHKMNSLHLHFTDVNGFRLQSDTYPGLASAQSYSKVEIRHMQDLAKKYHITIVPEIDIPAHAKQITAYNPKLKFTCSDMIDQNNDGWTIDITKPENREWVKKLLMEFIPLFDSPVFHIGSDEYEVEWKQHLCPDIVNYAKERGFGSTADIFVDFINEMNAVVKSFGKRTEIWNWWDVEQNPTIQPDKDIIVEVWRGEIGKYTGMGYDVVSSDERVLYVGPGDPPGTDWDSDPKYVYDYWELPKDPKLQGFRVSTWSGAITGTPPSDAYFEWFSRRPREALAERAWGGPKSANVSDFEKRVDRIGTAPGVPEYAPLGGVKLTGTPFGTSPAWGDLPNTFDKVFDGDVNTFFDYVNPAGGYAGIDLGEGKAKRITKVRFHPRLYYLRRIVGGTFQGSNEGPDKGYINLSKVEWVPENGWSELTVTDLTPYRWLRFVGPDGGYTNIAEIEFYTDEKKDNGSDNHESQ